MNFKITQLLNAVQIDNLVNSQFEINDVVPNIYTCQNELPSSIMHLLAGGTTTLELPLKLKFDKVDALLLLFNIEGGLQITQNDTTLISDMGTSVIVDLSKEAEFFTTMLPCSFRFFFISGRKPEFLSDMLTTPLSVHLSTQKPSSLTLDQLSRIPEKYELPYAYHIHAKITDILCNFAAIYYGESNQTSVIEQIPDSPSYLAVMSELIHNHSNEPYSLSYFENRLGISRYRLCREYHALYGVSPIQDLNHTRIQNAKKLLLTSSLQIQEISNSVGFDDVTHFIRLFKRETGHTPGQFRQSLISVADSSANAFV